MDLFDERVLAALNDGGRRSFAHLLDEVGFSRNTLKLRLKRLVAQGVVLKEKTLSNGRGRPKYEYSVSPKVRKQVSDALSDPLTTLVTLPFSRLKHLCRFEKGGYCKQLRSMCDVGKRPQIPRSRE